jgi:hypothetical protein
MLSKRLKWTSALALFAATSFLNTAAFADTEIQAVPTNWRLQNYIGGSGVVAWFTGSTCTNGALNFPSSATADDKNRFFSLILSAKISSKTVGVYYETVSGNCQITSFFIQQ